MNDMDKKWIPKVVIAMVLGFAIGEVIYKLFDKFILPGDTFALLKESFVPVALILALLIVLYYYNKSKYDGDDSDDGSDD